MEISSVFPQELEGKGVRGQYLHFVQKYREFYLPVQSKMSWKFPYFFPTDVDLCVAG